MCAADVASTRTTVVSPPFRGPLLIAEIAFRHPGAVGSFGGMSVFYSADGSGGVTNGATTTRPSGSAVFEPASFRSTATTDLDEFPEHIIFANPGGDPTEVVVIHPRRAILDLDQVFLKVSVRSHPAGGAHVRGSITVIEFDSEADLANLV